MFTLLTFALQLIITLWRRCVAMEAAMVTEPSMELKRRSGLVIRWSSIWIRPLISVASNFLKTIFPASIFRLQISRGLIFILYEVSSSVVRDLFSRISSRLIIDDDTAMFMFASWFGISRNVMKLRSEPVI